MYASELVVLTIKRHSVMLCYLAGAETMTVSEDWRTHIEAWQGSGLRQTEYCRQHHLNYNSFITRLSEYRKTQGDAKPALIPVTVSEESTGTPLPSRPLVLILKQGHRLELPETVSAQWLSTLLRGLS
jgi:hypothetical protein